MKTFSCLPRHARLALAPAALAAALAGGPLFAVQPAAATTLLPAACPADATLVKLGKPMPRLAAAIAGTGTVTIVAIGSSSTAGAGASAPALTYPARLQALLRQRYPGRDITVINRGINGQDGPEMLARFDTDVAALKPDLVIWQAGVNALFRADGLATAGGILREAIARTRAIGADMLIVDAQYAPRIVADADTAPMVTLMSSIGEEENVPVFHRFSLMREWHEADGMPFEAFLWKDKFHMNDWGYDCFSRDLARAISANVDSQQRSADARPAAVPASAPANTPAKPLGITATSAVIPASATSDAVSAAKASTATAGPTAKTTNATKTATATD
ncbi:SGNH/GDSL hydrolase family protein [Ancylobacter sp. 6x-1]|uniref:SGNH/GDSL hydrolase family protein n=1 Tax=Ancylobacter crimeensis TaxID=2579147 RepID=A0ABT0DA35_9HYPH|nr:SGNH/GDSL hydrolase family protein [Ancylobacter crimeensis]MCK0196797.1 SGNH/GDSL hydrolase family protein [Ancylobacter crimeensis]